MEKKNVGYHVKEHKNMCLKLVSKVTLHFVWGQLTRKQTVDIAKPLLFSQQKHNRLKLFPVVKIRE